MDDLLKGLSAEEQIQLVQHAFVGKVMSLPEAERDKFIGELYAFMAQRDPARFAEAMRQVMEGRQG